MENFFVLNHKHSWKKLSETLKIDGCRICLSLSLCVCVCVCVILRWTDWLAVADGRKTTPEPDGLDEEKSVCLCGIRVTITRLHTHTHTHTHNYWSRSASTVAPGLNLCRNKPDPDPAPPKYDPAPHFGRSPSSRANESCSCCWPIACTYLMKNLLLWVRLTHIYTWNSKLKCAKYATCEWLLTWGFSHKNECMDQCYIHFLSQLFSFRNLLC